MICSPDGLMRCNDSNAVVGDMPLLSQWIKKPYTIVYGFLVEMAVSEGWRLRLNLIICPSCLRLGRTDTRWTMRFRIPLKEKLFKHKNNTSSEVLFYGGTMSEVFEHCSIADFSPLKAASISSSGMSSIVTGLLLALIISVRWSS